MGTLEHRSTRRTVPLRTPLVIGRSSAADLRLEDPDVSGEHATLRWTEAGWEVRDLGSRNGTWVDGRRLEAGEQCRLTRMSALAFGTVEQVWEMVDDAAPAVLAVDLERGGAIPARGDVLPLGEDLGVYRAADGRWVFEGNDAERPVADRDIVVVGGRAFRIHLPVVAQATGDSADEVALGDVRLCFRVSPDEEYVHLEARSTGRVLDLGARAHHYTLLILARARLDDRESDVSMASAGWLYHDELARRLGVAGAKVRIDIFRARRQLAEAGIVGGAAVVERRTSTGQLRLGVDDVQVVVI